MTRMPAENMIRVVLADDNLIVREGVRALLLAAGTSTWSTPVGAYRVGVPA